MANKDTHIVLLVLNRFEFKDKESKAPTGKGFETRVVHVVSADGKSRGVGVEKVYFYEDGKKFIGKPLQVKDLETVWANREEIKALSKNPPPIPPPAPIEALTGGTLGGGDGVWGDRKSLGDGGGIGGGSIGGGQIGTSEEF